MAHTEKDIVKTLGAMSPREASTKLREMGETEAADALDKAGSSKGIFNVRAGISTLLGRDRKWAYTTHALGHIALGEGGESGESLIKSASSLAPDPSLKGAKLKISLATLRVAEYPGGGVHHVLFGFYANNLTSTQVEQLAFSSTFRAHEGQSAGIIGYPIFLGLHAPAEGLALRCVTVNVKNEGDQKLIAFLESGVFRMGLQLAESVQPAIVPFSAMATGLLDAVAKRNQNVPVQDIYFGLDFSTLPGGARLREGAYIAVQIPDRKEHSWKWDDWVYDHASGQILDRQSRSQLIPYNYLLLGIVRMEEAHG
jgi:hypothetical protein